MNMSRLRLKSVEFVKKTYSSAKDYLSSMSSTRVSQPDSQPQPKVNFDVRFEEFPFVIAPELITLCNELSAKLAVSGDDFHSVTSGSYSNSTLKIESKPPTGNSSSQGEKSTNSQRRRKKSGKEQPTPNHGLTITFKPQNESNTDDRSNFKPDSILLSDGGSLAFSKLENEARYTQLNQDTKAKGLAEALKDQNIRVKILKLPLNKLLDKRELSRTVPIFTIDTLSNSKIEIVSSQSRTKLTATVDNTNVKINKDTRKMMQTVDISSTDMKSKNWNGTDQPDETPNTSGERENKSSKHTKRERRTFERSEREPLETENSPENISDTDHSTEREEEINSSNERRHQSNDKTGQIRRLNQRSGHYKSNYYATKQGHIGQKEGSNDSDIIQHDSKRQQTQGNQEMNHQAKFQSMQSNLDANKVEIIAVDPNYNSITKFNSLGSMQFTQRVVKGRTQTESPTRNKFGLSKTDALLSPRVYSMRNYESQSGAGAIERAKKDKEEIVKPKKHEAEKMHRLKRGRSMLPVPLRPYKRISESLPDPNPEPKSPQQKIPPTPSVKVSRRVVVTEEHPTKNNMKKPITQSQMIRQAEVTNFMKTRGSELKRQLSRNNAQRAISIGPNSERNNEIRKEIDNTREVKFENTKIKDSRKTVSVDKTNGGNNNPTVKARNTISNVNRIGTVKTSKNIVDTQKTLNDTRIHRIDANHAIENEDSAKDSVKVLFRNKIEHRDESVEKINATPLKVEKINATPLKVKKINATPLKPTEIKPSNSPRKRDRSQRRMSRLRLKKIEKTDDLDKIPVHIVERKKDKRNE